MHIILHYRITQNRAGKPIEFAAARRFPSDLGSTLENQARQEIANDYDIPLQAVEIIGPCRR